MNTPIKPVKKQEKPTFVYVDIDDKKIVKIAQKMRPAIIQLAQS